MKLYLVRHGPAYPRDPARWPGDTARPLSPQGSRETRAVARAFARVVGAVDWIGTSPARRTTRTAEIFAEELEPAPSLRSWPELGIGRAPLEAFERLVREARPSGAVVLVGHAPGLAQLVGLALTAETVPIAHLRKAGTAAIEFPRRVAPGAGRLEWLLTRKQWGAARR
ncbi:MAG: SixA phosphatase family protein [Thermoplasmata archaeon]